MTPFRRRRYPIPALLATLALLLPPAATAQSTSATATEVYSTNTAWNAWLGCWEPIDSRTRGAIATTDRPTKASATIVCVLPEPNTSAVEFATIADGKIVDRTRIDASGQKRDRTIEGCTGWESATWSADRGRIFLHSEFTCPGDIQRRSTGILAIAPGVQWLDIQGVTIAGQTATRALRYRAVQPNPELTARLPAEIATALGRGQTLAAWTARSAAAAPIDIDAVIDASRRLDTPVSSAWLVEQAQGFSVDAKELRRLAAAKVPADLIDLLVALSYPTVFAINRTAVPTATEAPPTNVTHDGNATRTSTTNRGWDPMGFYGLGYYGYGAAYYDRYTFGPYDNFYRGYSSGWYRGPTPIVIVPRDKADEDYALPTRGRVVNGRGYSRDRAGAPAGSATRSSSPSSGSTANTNSKPSAGSSGSSSSSGGAERKAKPRGT